MFVFLDADADAVVSTNTWTRDDYRAAQATPHRRTCLGCGSGVILSMRRATDTYFAKHRSLAECTFDSNESREHQLMKLEIEQALLEAGWDAKAEWRRVNTDGEVHVADVSASKNGRTVAFEVQLSPQSAEETVSRHVRRLRSGVNECWWVFGERSWAANRSLAEVGFPASTSAHLDAEIEWPKRGLTVPLITPTGLAAWAVKVADLAALPSSPWGRISDIVRDGRAFTRDDLAHMVSLPRDISEGLGIIVADTTVALSGVGALSLGGDGKILPTLSTGTTTPFDGCPRCGIRTPRPDLTIPDRVAETRIVVTDEPAFQCSPAALVTLPISTGPQHDCHPGRDPEWQQGFERIDQRELTARVARAAEQASLGWRLSDDGRALLVESAEFRLPNPREPLPAGAGRQLSVVLVRKDGTAAQEAAEYEGSGLPVLVLSGGAGHQGTVGPFEPLSALVPKIATAAREAAQSEWSEAWRAKEGAATAVTIRPSIATAVLGSTPFQSASRMVVYPALTEVVCECGQLWDVHTGTSVLPRRCKWKKCGGSSERIALVHDGQLTPDEVSAIQEPGELVGNSAGEFSCDCGRALSAAEYRAPWSNEVPIAHAARYVDTARTHTCTAHVETKVLRRAARQRTLRT